MRRDCWVKGRKVPLELKVHFPPHHSIWQQVPWMDTSQCTGRSGELGHSPAPGVSLQFSETGKRMWQESVRAALHLTPNPHPHSCTPFGRNGARPSTGPRLLAVHTEAGDKGQRSPKGRPRETRNVDQVEMDASLCWRLRE